MSLRVGLDTSEADLDVQGEIDFDFFEASETSSNLNKTPFSHQESSRTLESTDEKSENGSNPLLDHKSNLKEQDLNMANVLESSCSNYLNKPMITVSCDDATGFVQKTTIETVIPTPYNYKDNKCGKTSPLGSKKTKRVLSPRLKNKVFSDEIEISDDSSISSMSESESDLSSVSEDSFELGGGSDSMTDVTPLNSPYKCNSPMPNKLKFQKVKASEITEKDLKKEGVKFPDDFDEKDCSKCDAIDIHELLKAVKRLEMGQNINTVCRGKSAPPSVITQNAKCRKNLSFSNEEVRRIDNDNRVLLKKIVAQQTRQKPRTNLSARVMSSSAVNRQRQQRRIELDNLVCPSHFFNFKYLRVIGT